MLVGAGLAGEQLIAIKAISWYQSAWSHMTAMANQILWNQKRRLKGAFSVRRQAGSHKQGRPVGPSA